MCYDFLEATPLIDFIKENQGKLIGQRICGYYSDAGFGTPTDCPVVFELEQFSIVLEYYIYSDLSIHIVDSKCVQNDLSLNFLYKDIPESCNLRLWVDRQPVSFLGERITAIDVNRFSKAFEINPATGEMRPDGGDYFSTIILSLESGRKINISAADAVYDGYAVVWLPEKNA